MPDKALKEDRQDIRDIGEADEILLIQILIPYLLNIYYMLNMVISTGDAVTYIIIHSFNKFLFNNKVPCIVLETGDSTGIPDFKELRA